MFDQELPEMKSRQRWYGAHVGVCWMDGLQIKRLIQAFSGLIEIQRRERDTPLFDRDVINLICRSSSGSRGLALPRSTLDFS